MTESAKSSTTAEIATGRKSRLCLLLLLFLTSSAVAMAFGLVWLNVERNNLAYSLRLAYQERTALLDSNAKLSNQIAALLSPHVLGSRAEEFGLRNPKPSQAWRLGEDKSSK